MPLDIDCPGATPGDTVLDEDETQPSPSGACVAPLHADAYSLDALSDVNGAAVEAEPVEPCLEPSRTSPVEPPLEPTEPVHHHPEYRVWGMLMLTNHPWVEPDPVPKPAVEASTKSPSKPEEEAVEGSPDFGVMSVIDTEGSDSSSCVIGSSPSQCELTPLPVPSEKQTPPGTPEDLPADEPEATPPHEPEDQPADEAGKATPAARALNATCKAKAVNKSKAAGKTKPDRKRNAATEAKTDRKRNAASKAKTDRKRNAASNAKTDRKRNAASKATADRKAGKAGTDAEAARKKPAAKSSASKKRPAAAPASKTSKDAVEKQLHSVSWIFLAFFGHEQLHSVSWHFSHTLL